MRGVLGIDEAGRGPVFGPMVVAGVLGPDERPGIGARDSKRMTPSARRRKLLEILRDERLTVDVEIVWPWEIDEEGVNEAELRAMSALIRRHRPDLALVDKPGNYDPDRVRRALRPPRGVTVIAEDRADERYEIVSAASIVAKTYRDWIVRLLELEFGVEIGSGYPSDPRTVRALRRELRRKGPLLEYFRRSWSTYDRLASELGQSTLDEFV